MLNKFKKEFLPKSFLLFRQLMRTCVLFLTDVVTTDKGPVLNSSSSRRSNSSGVISDLGLFNVVDPDAILMMINDIFKNSKLHKYQLLNQNSEFVSILVDQFIYFTH